jgi:hypothetical protein
MSETYNIYCDESCHLENDHLGIMVLGAVWCPAGAARDVAAAIRSIKERHGVNPAFELKWTKVSGSKPQLYLDILDYFFDTVQLNFRAVLIPDKSLLRHSEFGQTHDDWYYKMYFTLLKTILRGLDTRRARMETRLRPAPCGTAAVVCADDSAC